MCLEPKFILYESKSDKKRLSNTDILRIPNLVKADTDFKILENYFFDIILNDK